MIKESFNLEGEYKIYLNDKLFGSFKNLITTIGKTYIRDNIYGDFSNSTFQYIAIGTSATAPAVGQIQLVAENARSVIVARTKISTNQLKVSANFNFEIGIGTIREIGIFMKDATSVANSGTMFSRITPTAFVKDSETILIVEYTLTIS